MGKNDKAAKRTSAKPSPKPKAAAKAPAKKVKAKGPAAKKTPEKKPAAAPKPKVKAPAPAAKPKAKAPAAAPKPKPKASSSKGSAPSPEQARRSAERLVGALIRDLLISRKRNYLDGMKIEKKYYATPLFEESRKTVTRYLDAEGREKLLKVEVVEPTSVHVYTSGEGMGKNRYVVAFERKEWKISSVDVMCADCAGAGSCRWCEGKGCLDCQQSGRCVPCSGSGWSKWAK